MPSSLAALGDDGVAALALQPARLLDRGRRGDDLGAGVPYPPEQRLFRQAEMEAHHLGPQFDDQIAKVRVERRPSGPAGIVAGSIPNSA